MLVDLRQFGVMNEARRAFVNLGGPCNGIRYTWKFYKGSYSLTLGPRHVLHRFLDPLSNHSVVNLQLGV